MKILLVEPKMPKPLRVGTGLNEIVEPMGLCYISSYLKKHGYNTKIIQQYFMTDKEIVRKIVNEKPDIIGFTAFTCTYPRVKRLVKAIKEKINVLTVLGGVHATADPINSCRDFDVVVLGEGEETMLELVRKISKGKDWRKIKGIAYYNKEKNKEIINPRRDRINFASQPWPDRSDLNIKIYKSHFITNIMPSRVRNVATILSSKGCPYNCSFCTNKLMWNQIVRARPIKDVVDEMEMLNKKYQVDYIWFHDETFTFDKNRIKELYREIIKRKLDIYWGCMGRVNNVDIKTVRMMKKAGCRYIGYGVESADSQILKKINKQITLKVIEKAMKITFDVGIIPRAYFMIGLPYDTRKTLKKMKRFAIKIHALSYRFSNFYPFLGTRDREFIDKNNLWLPNAKRLTHATTLTPVVKCKANLKFVQKFTENVTREIYSSSAYQKRKEKFIKRNPEYRESFDNWKEYQDAIRK